MGLLKRIVGWIADAERVTREPVRNSTPKSRRIQPKPKPAPAPPPIWIPADHAVTIQGFDLLDGMIYVGQRAGHPHPSMIDLTLSIDIGASRAGGSGVERGSSYNELSPRLRAAYLDWLSTGRRRTNAPISFVFLFFYGLERRILTDLKAESGYDLEIDGIRGEVAALLEVYGPLDSTFDEHARGFLDFLDFRRLLANPQLAFPPPKLDEVKRPPSILLKAELARIAGEKRPLPPDRALAWSWYLPTVHPRTPATRCKREFVRLFMIRYMAQNKDGLAISPGAQPLTISYRPSSSGIGTTRLKHPTLTDVFPQAEPAALLRNLFNQVSEELDPYSRWLGRNPQSTNTLAAAAMLPTELLMRSTGAIRDLKTWVDGKLGADKRASVGAIELIALWNGSDNQKLTKSESIQIAQLLGRLNVGIEPDPRFGGPPLTNDTTAILFRTEAAAPEISSPEYASASVLVHLAAAVGTSEGNVTNNELEPLGQHLETAMQLSAPERLRLQAHLQWLAKTGIKLTGLKKRFSSIDTTTRESVGEMLIAIASIDRSITPAEVTTLMKIYSLLGLDPTRVTSQLHGSMTAPRRGPVVVRPAVAGAPGVDVPVRPSFFLDAASIQAKLAETAAVSRLLGDIFVDDEPVTTTATTPAAPQETAPTIAGLDSRHAGLFREVAAKDEWSRDEFNAMAERAALMPEGAIDTLNEAAYEIAGEPLLEGDDPIVINSFAREEMSA